MGFTLGLKSKREGVIIRILSFLGVSFRFRKEKAKFSFSRFNLVYQASKRIL